MRAELRWLENFCHGSAACPEQRLDKVRYDLNGGLYPGNNVGIQTMIDHDIRFAWTLMRFMQLRNISGLGLPMRQACTPIAFVIIAATGSIAGKRPSGELELTSRFVTMHCDPARTSRTAVVMASNE